MFLAVKIITTSFFVLFLSSCSDNKDLEYHGPVDMSLLQTVWEGSTSESDSVAIVFLEVSDSLYEILTPIYFEHFPNSDTADMIVSMIKSNEKSDTIYINGWVGVLPYAVVDDTLKHFCYVYYFCDSFQITKLTDEEFVLKDISHNSVYYRYYRSEKVFIDNSDKVK